MFYYQRSVFKKIKIKSVLFMTDNIKISYKYNGINGVVFDFVIHLFLSLPIKHILRSKHTHIQHV